MAMSAEQVQGLADAVAVWRMQEYLTISFYCLYVYYVSTTLAEEVSIILPQRWNRGKMLYMIIRYGLLVHAAEQLLRDHRNYFSLSPIACKVLRLIAYFPYFASMVACEWSLGLCLGALLQAASVYLVAIVIASCGMTLITAVINLVSYIQYPAEPVPRLVSELGYPCYVPSSRTWSERTIADAGRDVRGYVNVAATTLLALLGVATLAVRYKGQDGRLVQVIRRDGGIHYMSLLTLRMANAILRTPTVMSVSEIGSSPAFLLVQIASNVIVPILAQRLLINMRKVDYMGSEPIASKLLFAPPAPGSEDDLEGDFVSFEMAQVPSDLRHRGAGGGASEVGENGEGSRSV